MAVIADMPSSEPLKPETTSQAARRYPLSPRDSHQCRHCDLFAHHANTTTTAPVKDETETTESKLTTSNAPLGPPPRPTTTADAPDYFNTYVRRHVHPAWSEFQERFDDPTALAIDSFLLSDSTPREDLKALLDSDDPRLPSVPSLSPNNY
jgi:hypothetical protein